MVLKALRCMRYCAALTKTSKLSEIQRIFDRY